MVFYEYIFIVCLDMFLVQMEFFIEDVKIFIEEKGGKIGKIEYWGLCNFVYCINKFCKGYYGFIDIDVFVDVIDELDCLQCLFEDIICYMMVCVDEYVEMLFVILIKKDDCCGCCECI